jgi:glycosyltransferase involved in cell wall biosynthesis
LAETTIVIPLYHPNPRYLDVLFDSILKQVYQDFDIVISDDGADKAIIDKSLPSSLEPRTLYVKNERKKGIFGNLNNGIQHAKGEFIQIFCQDDAMLPLLLESNAGILRANADVDMVFSSFDFMSEEGKPIPLNRKDMKFIPTVLKPGEANNYFLFFGCMPGNLSPVMIRKTLFDKAGWFDEDMKYAGDFEYWIRASKHTNLYFSKAIHLYVRNHDERASATLGTYKRFNEIKRILDYLIQHNQLPATVKTLKRYVHIYLFRGLFSYTAKRLFVMKKSEWKELWQIFDGRPYSWKTAIVTFFYPKSRAVKQLIQHMEVARP